jgi:hypothetical protein
MLGTVRREPALSYITVLSTIVGLVVAFVHLDTVQAGYLTAIVGALATILTAVHARPVPVAVIGGAVTTILSSLVVFKLNLDAGEIHAIAGAVVIGLGLLSGYHLRGHLVPAIGPVGPPRD